MQLLYRVSGTIGLLSLSQGTSSSQCGIQKLFSGRDFSGSGRVYYRVPGGICTFRPLKNKISNFPGGGILYCAGWNGHSLKLTLLVSLAPLVNILSFSIVIATWILGLVETEKYFPLLQIPLLPFLFQPCAIINQIMWRLNNGNRRKLI